jgi:transcriptional antiterminator RfaH
MSLAWYAMHSKPNKEEFLCQQLSSKQINHFYPCIQVTPINPRSRKIRPYFPGYLFVHLDLEEAAKMPALQWMPGATGLVSFDGKAAEVPEGLIAALKQHLSEESLVRKQEHIFKPGDHIKVLNGPFDGYDGFFDTTLSGTERVRILIELVRGYAIKVDLPANSIKKNNQKVNDS